MSDIENSRNESDKSNEPHVAHGLSPASNDLSIPASMDAQSDCAHVSQKWDSPENTGSHTPPAALQTTASDHTAEFGAVSSKRVRQILGDAQDVLQRNYRAATDTTDDFVHESPWKAIMMDSNPADTKLIPVSRTIGADRVVDEFLFCATHDREIDWLLPGLEPTGKYFEVPMLAVIRFRGNKLYNEHIYWDQASVLVQIGALDPTGLPIAGIQTAKKMGDETLPINTLMPNWALSEGKPF